jgi:methyl-accepting chemotaxis protein
MQDWQAYRGASGRLITLLQSGEQVGNAIAQLDQVTQQNAALVEESAAAAESMRHQAAQLARTVAVFNVGAGLQLA